MEGECWENAIAEFRQAIDFLSEDTRNARPYGRHFRDYFPHREMGICYLHLGHREQHFYDPSEISLIIRFEMFSVNPLSISY